MCHKFLVLSVKKWLKSVHIYGSYRKIKTGVPYIVCIIIIGLVDIWFVRLFNFGSKSQNVISLWMLILLLR